MFKRVLTLTTYIAAVATVIITVGSAVKLITEKKD